MDEALVKHLVNQEENRYYKDRMNDLMVYRYFELNAPLTIQGKSYHPSPIPLSKLKMLKSIIENQQEQSSVLSRIEMTVHGMSVQNKKIVERAYLRSLKDRGVTALSGHKIAISMLLFPLSESA